MSSNKETIILNYLKRNLEHFQNFIVNKNILDIGCGSGLDAYFLERFCNCNLTLTDIKDFREDKAKKFPFFKASAVNLPFKKEEFEISFIQFILHHISSKINLIDIIKESSRVSKKILIIEEIIDDDSDIEKAIEFDKKMNNILHHGIEMPFNKFYFERELIEIFSNANLNLIEKIEIDKGNFENGKLKTYLFLLEKNE